MILIFGHKRLIKLLRLEYCILMLRSLPLRPYDSIQSVLLAALRFIVPLPPMSSVTALMSSKLHWLSFSVWVHFKVAVLA